MSDSIIRYIPIEPTYRPSLENARNAQRILRDCLPEAELISAKTSDHVGFVDAGENWDGVICLCCGADAEPWWGDAMSGCAENKFSSLIVKAGCCGNEVSLNQLNYVWPVGFAVFVLEVLNPNHKGLTPEQMKELSSAIGKPMREIFVHV